MTDSELSSETEPSDDNDDESANSSELPPFPHTKEDTVVPPPEHRDDKHLQTRRGFLKKVIGGAVAGAVLAGGGYGIYRATSSNEVTAEPPKTEPSAAATQTPGPVETAPTTSETTASKYQVEREYSAGELELPADATPEQLAELYVDRNNKWLNAGSNEAMGQKWFNFGNPQAGDAMITEISKKNAKPFIEALLPKDYKDRKDLADFASGMTKVNDVNMDLYARTSPAMMDPTSNKEAYGTWDTINGDIEVTNDSDGSSTIAIPVMEHDNADKNSAQYFAQKRLTRNGSTYTMVIGFGKEGDKTVMTSYDSRDFVPGVARDRFGPVN